ncbi:hypothetical protein TNCV_4882271 [Trichonephila clavipes]|nr:hypothetical protein TNCV_4882271 [Trichonephila clavipes]
MSDRLRNYEPRSSDKDNTSSHTPFCKLPHHAKGEKNDKIGNLIVCICEEVVDLTRQINLELESDDVQERRDSYNQGADNG